MKKISLAYFGTPDFAAQVLQEIITGTELPIKLICVVTQPDRPVGRKQVITSSPVKLMAKNASIPVFVSLSDPRLVETLHKTDLVLLYAYGALIPHSLLTLPVYGFWNIHPSLLPQYRGTSPVAYSLLMGDLHTGVSLMQMDEQWDHGALIDQVSTDILPHETHDLLIKRLSDQGYELFKKNVQLLIDGKLQKHEQNHQNATYTRLLTKKDGFIPFFVFGKIIRGEKLTQDDCPPLITEYQTKYGADPGYDYSLSVYYLYRALHPWPGLWTLLPLRQAQGSEGQASTEKRLKITRMDMAYSKPVITHVQLEGKKEVDVKTFLQAYPLL